MGQAFTPVEQDLMRRLVAAERKIEAMQRATAGQAVLYKKSTAQLVTGAAFADIPGAQIAIARPGLYIVLASYDISVTVASAGNVVHTTLVAAAGATVGFLLNGFHSTIAADLFETRVAMAVVSCPVVGGTVTMQARRTAGTVSIESANANTGMIAWRAAPV